MLMRIYIHMLVRMVQTHKSLSPTQKVHHEITDHKVNHRVHGGYNTSEARLSLLLLLLLHPKAQTRHKCLQLGTMVSTTRKRQQMRHVFHLLSGVVLLFWWVTITEAAKLKGSKVTFASTTTQQSRRLAFKSDDEALETRFGFSERGFKLACKTFLQEAAADGMLSQYDYADFVYKYCRASTHKGPSCSSPRKGESFQSLSVDMQMNFAGSRCPPYDKIASLECLQFLNDSKQEFGYTEEVSELCSSSYSLMMASDMISNGK
jgi:hypothetical protein